MRRSLILAGGGIKVAFQAGVLEVWLDEAGLSFDHVDAASGTIALKARFENTDRRLWPGQFVNVRVLLRVIPAAITIPLAAVNRGPTQSFAYVIGADHTAAMRPITIESVQGRTAIIRSGLQSGERVVVDGQMSLKPGMPVIVSDATARAPAAP